jgi:hypothetical protein
MRQWFSPDNLRTEENYQAVGDGELFFLGDDEDHEKRKERREKAEPTQTWG